MPDADELERGGNVCIECGGEQPAGERGWRAYLTAEEEPVEAVVYCPECAAREFGDVRSAV